MRGLSSPAFWLVSRATGLRLYHLVGLAAAPAVALGIMAVPFWWLGEQADAAIGAPGIAIVAIVYLYAATLVLAAAALLVGRLLLGRVRRLFA